MSNIFDYFVKKFQPPTEKPPQQRIVLEPYKPKPIQTPIRDVFAEMNAPEMGKERIVLEPPPQTVNYGQGREVDADPMANPNDLPAQSRIVLQPPPPKLSPASMLEQERINLDVLENPNNPNFQPVENQDKGVWGRIKDIGREAIIGAGQTYQETGNLESALGGGIAGAFGGGFRPTLNEERQRKGDIQQSRIRLDKYQKEMDAEQQRLMREAQRTELERRPEKEVQGFLNKQTLQNDRFKQQTEMEAKKQANRIAAILKKDELNKGKYKIEAMKDGSGRLIKKYPDREEPFLDPDTGEQLTDPFEKGYEYTTESGQNVQIKGNQIASVEAAKAFRDSVMGWNQTKYNSDIEGENAEDAAKYQADLNKANAERSGYDAQLKGIDDQMNFLSQQNAELRRELDSIAPDVSEDGNRRRAQIQSTISQNDAAFTKLKGDRGQVEGKRKAVADPVKPPPRKAVSAPKTGNTGKPVSIDRDPKGYFQ